MVLPTSLLLLDYWETEKPQGFEQFGEKERRDATGKQEAPI